MLYNMSPLPFLSKSRGIRNLLSRIKTVFINFGISSKKFERLLIKYSTVTKDLGCVPTFPITAVTLKRHPKVIRKLSQNGIEFAVHGYIHTDYGVLTLEEQVRHFKKAISTFVNCMVPYTGFRAPFVRTNNQTFQALSSLGFLYDSSDIVHWDVIDGIDYSENARSEYRRILDFYQSRKAQDYLVLPRLVDGFVEIPVSMPDDEIMVERLDITDEKRISEIWGAILESSYDRGELLTLQLHPERISFCEKALIDIMRRSKALEPWIWVASLKEIARWWQEKESFNFDICTLNNGLYRVKSHCSNRATILLKNVKVNVPKIGWFNGYESISAKEFLVESPVRPVIGLRKDSPAAMIKFFRREGYIVELDAEPGNCGIYFGNLTDFSEDDEKLLSREAEKSDAPLIRYWRWPNQTRSALSITGDIDSITLKDFVLRIFENWFQKRN